MEHALCEFDKYYRSAISQPVKERLYTESTSRTAVDAEQRCGTRSSRTSSPRARVSCPPYGHTWHIACRGEAGLQRRGQVWLCPSCSADELLWAQEDFAFQVQLIFFA